MWLTDVGVNKIYKKERQAWLQEGDGSMRMKYLKNMELKVQFSINKLHYMFVQSCLRWRSSSEEEEM